ncbi:winged helix-turn-helix domain-containing protein [Niabella hibiscisoli]|uniref:winged helix-turn-helix domain-containing protein n=1 Tax=Niabella hibiscisoli TaxID=1825928 RepID=UPI001F0FA71F|nr:winged helix-turn-helix domain-containing protein [Niabella hibiscisoli]MCH5719491.1 winged helix-turn-helix domain-containing protein [Niabella hibiscisoli]
MNADVSAAIKNAKMPKDKMKYQQLADYIITLIENDELHIGDQIPSLKQLQQQLKMSKETLLKGLNELVGKGIIESVYRKGYFVRKKRSNITSGFFYCSIR